MTGADKKPRQPIPAEKFVAKLRARQRSYGDRQQQYVDNAFDAAKKRFERREAAWRCGLLTLVDESERPAAVTMAQTLGLEIDAAPSEPTPSRSDDVQDDANGVVEDETPSWLNEEPPPKSPVVEIDRSKDGRKVGVTR